METNTWLDHFNKLYSEDQPTQKEPKSPEITIDEQTRIDIVEAQGKLINRQVTGEIGIANEL